MVRVTLFVCLCFMVACNPAEKKQKETKTIQQVVTSEELKSNNDWTILRLFGKLI